MKKILSFLSLPLLMLIIAGVYSCADDIVFKDNNSVAYPPGAPTQVGVDNTTSSSFLAYWSKPLFLGTLPGGGEASISYYEISYSRNSDFTPDETDRINPSTDGNKRIEFPITGLDPNTSYYVRIKVYNNNSDSKKNSSEYKIYNNGSPVITISAESPPSPPSGIRFSNYGEESFDVTWSAPIDLGKKPDGSAAKITGYKLEWDVTRDFSTTDIFTVVTTRTTHPIRNLRPNTSYYVRIYSINDNGGNNTSLLPLQNKGNPAKTLSLETKPDAPSNIRLIKLGKREVRISFDAVPPVGYGLFPEGNKANLARYDLLISESSLFTNAIPIPTTVNSGVPIANLTPGTDYYLRVRSVNDNLGPLRTDQNNPFRFSDWGNYNGIIRTKRDSSPPGSVKSVSSSSILPNRLTVSWGAPKSFGKRSKGDSAQLINYRIRWSTTFDFAGSSVGFTTKTSYTVEQLTPNESYFFEVVTISDSDDETNNYSSPEYLNGSRTNSVKTQSAESSPERPRELQTITVGQREVQLKWQAPSSLGKTVGGDDPVFRGYKIYYSDSDSTLSLSNTGTSQTQVFPSGNGNSDYIRTTKTVIPNLTPNKKYYMAVVAVNSNASINSSGLSYLTSSIDGSVKTRSAVSSPATPEGLGLRSTQKFTANIFWKVSPVENPYGLLPNGTSGTVIRYEVQLSTDPGFDTKTTTEQNFPATSANPFQATLRDLSPDIKYYWRVRAVNTNPDPNKYSPYSTSRASFKTDINSRPPSKVQSFRAGTSSNTQNEIYVSWRAPLDPGADSAGRTASVEMYRIYYSTTSPIDKDRDPYVDFPKGASSGVIDGKSSSLSGAIPQPGRAYYMAMVVMNDQKLFSEDYLYDDTVARTASAEEPPGLIESFIINPGTDSAVLSFSPPSRASFGKNPKGDIVALEGFEVYVDKTESLVKLRSSQSSEITTIPYLSSQSIFSYTLTSLTPNTTYHIAIFTTNKNNTPKNISEPYSRAFQTTQAFKGPSAPLSLITFSSGSRAAILQVEVNPAASGKGANGTTDALYEKFILDICRKDLEGTDFCGMDASDLEKPYLINPKEKQRIYFPYNGLDTKIFKLDIPVSYLRPGSVYVARVFAVNNNAKITGKKYSGLRLLQSTSFNTTSAETKPFFSPVSEIKITKITSNGFVVSFSAFSPGLNSYGDSYSIVDKYKITVSPSNTFDSSNPETKSIEYNTGLAISGLQIFDSPSPLPGDTAYFVKVEAYNTNTSENRSDPLVYKAGGAVIASTKTSPNFQKPDKPGSFTVSSIRSDGFIDFNITPVSDADAGRSSKGVQQTIARYEIIRSESPNVNDPSATRYELTPASVATASTIISVGATSPDPKTMAPGKVYYFYARAVNTDGAPSNDTSINNSYNPTQKNIVRIPTGTEAPSNPTEVKILDLNTGANKTSPYIQLQWTPPSKSANGGYGKKKDGTPAAVKEYVIRFYSSSFATNTFQTPAAVVKIPAPAGNQPLIIDATVHQDTPKTGSISLLTKYHISVTAVNDADDIGKDESPRSNEVFALMGDRRPSGLANTPILRYVGYNKIILQANPTATEDIGLRGGIRNTSNARYIFYLSETTPIVVTPTSRFTTKRGNEQAVFSNLKLGKKYYIMCVLSNNNPSTDTSDSRSIPGGGTTTNSYITNKSPATPIEYEVTTFGVLSKITYQVKRSAAVVISSTNRRAYGTNITRRSASEETGTATRVLLETPRISNIENRAVKTSTNVAVPSNTAYITAAGGATVRSDLPQSVSTAYTDRTYGYTPDAAGENFFSDVTEYRAKASAAGGQLFLTQVKTYIEPLVSPTTPTYSNTIEISHGTEVIYSPLNK